MKATSLLVTTAALGFLLSAEAQSTLVTVPANPLWTETPVTVTAGQVITINANGMWNWAPGTFNIADGDDVGSSFNEFLNNSIGGSLVAYVGTTPPYDSFPNQTSFPLTKNGQTFPQSSLYWQVGSTVQFYCPNAGTLYLGINDDSFDGSVGDNFNSVTAQIFVGSGKTNSFPLAKPALFAPRLVPGPTGFPDGNKFSFTVSGATNMPWAVYDSSDLTNWVLLGIVQADTNGVGEFTNVTGVAYRYYKVNNDICTSEATPVVPESLYISGGYGHSAAVDFSGNVWAWGRNNFGQLGQGQNGLGQNNTQDSPVPEMVTSLTTVNGVTQAVEVSCGYDYTLALMADGTVLGWGGNMACELGNNTIGVITNTSPSQVLTNATDPLSSVVAIAANGNEDGPGVGYGLALSIDGAVWHWGGFGFLEGQPAENETHQVATPITPSLSNTKIVAIAAGGQHIMVLAANGMVYAEGDDAYGQCGDGYSGYPALPYDSTWVQVKDSSGHPLTNIISIAAGGLTSYAIRGDGTLWSWGANTYGQLGINVSPNSVPCSYAMKVPFSYAVTVVAVTGGANHCLAMGTDGSLWAWGDDTYGQLGDGNGGTGKYSTVPVLIGFSSQTHLSQGSGSQWAGIAAGTYHSLAVENITGAVPVVLSWGWNFYGQLGNKSTTQELTPVNVLASGGGNFNFGL